MIVEQPDIASSAVVPANNAAKTRVFASIASQLAKINLDISLRWRKLKGNAAVKLADGTICHAEVHWYEAHGTGAKEFKIKRILEIQ